MSRSRAALLRALLFACLLLAASALSWPGKGKKEDDAKTGDKGALTTVDKLHIGIKRRVADCTETAKDGDHVYVHYRGTLTNGEQFDASCACPAPHRRPRALRRQRSTACARAACMALSAPGGAWAAGAAGNRVDDLHAACARPPAQTTATRRSTSRSARALSSRAGTWA